MKVYYEQQARLLDKDIGAVDRSAYRFASMSDDSCVILHPVQNATHSAEPTKPADDYSGISSLIDTSVVPLSIPAVFSPPAQVAMKRYSFKMSSPSHFFSQFASPSWLQ